MRVEMTLRGATSDAELRAPVGTYVAGRAAAVTHATPPRGRPTMLWTIFVVLLVLWALGMVSSYTIGGFIHILLVIAIAVVLIRIIQGRRPI